jgi:hypothetical protein
MCAVLLLRIFLTINHFFLNFYQFDCIFPFLYIYNYYFFMENGNFRHAGYSYSGRAAAYAFGNIDPTNMLVR